MLNYKIFTKNDLIPKSRPIRYTDGEISSHLKNPLAVESLNILLTHNYELAKINSWKDFLKCTPDQKQFAFGNIYNMMFNLAVYERNNAALCNTRVVAVGCDELDNPELVAVMETRYGNRKIYCSHEMNSDNLCHCDRYFLTELNIAGF